MDDFVLLGKVTRAHGIRGEIKVYPYSGDPGNFKKYRTLYLSAGADTARRAFVCQGARIQGNQVLLRLEGCGDRDQAQRLVGREVWLRREDLPELDEDEFYLHELEGRLVVTNQGDEVGRVTGILATGAHDILVVRDGTREHLVPLVAEFLVRIEDDRVVLDLPPGLLEIND